MSLKKFILIGLLAGALSGCASVIEGQSEMITMRTPGTDNARCYIDNGVTKVPAYSNETVRVEKNYKDLIVSCQAPGNREVTKTVPLEPEPWTLANVANGLIPGMAYDLGSKAIYKYPDEISVNFTGLKATEYPIPMHNAKDGVQPDDVNLEEYMPASPRLNSDRYATTPEVKKITPADRASYNPFVSTSMNGGAGEGTASSAQPTPLVNE